MAISTSRVRVSVASNFIVLFVFLPSVRAGDDRAAEEAVLTLDASNFNEAIKKHPFIVVKSYAHWCRHCKNLTPEYEKAAAALCKHDPPVILAKVDTNEEANKDLVAKYEVRGFPTLKIIKNGGDNIQDYKGPREADGIIEYLKKQVGPASAEIKSPKYSLLVCSPSSMARSLITLWKLLKKCVLNMNLAIAWMLSFFRVVIRLRKDPLLGYLSHLMNLLLISRISVWKL